MSTSISVIYAPGRSVSVKTTPTTTLQAILVSACASMPKPPSPDSYTLVYNSKTLDLTLPLRFANLPQGAKLTLTHRASTRPSPKLPANQVASPQASTPSATVKVALQLVGSSRIIADFDPSTTLWNIIVAAQTSSGRTLNLVNKFRPAEPPTSPQSSEGKSGWGSGFLQSLISVASGSSSPKTPPQQPITPPVAQSWFYQQPVLLLLNKEYATNYDLQHTTLRSLGFTSGSVMVRFSYRPAKEPTSLEAVYGSQSGDSASPTIEAASAQPVSPPVVTPVQPPVIEEATHSDNALGIVAVPAPALAPAPAATPSEPSEPKSGLSLLLSTRQVSVLGAPPANAPALGSRIVLPESFYEAGSDDLRILVSVQKARVAESEKGFSSRVKQEEENRRRHAEFKAKHTRTLIRFRFPDQVQVQAAFSSHEETVAELYAFLNQVLVTPNVLESLIIQPPALNLDALRSKTLFDAKLAPAAVVHVKLASAKASTLEVLKPEVAALVENLKIPSPELVDDRPQETPASTSAAIYSSAKDALPLSQPQEQTRTTASNAATTEGPKMPKWFLAGQRR
ncbi:hypothetical protein GGH94_000528 [Coemansia aciculifera]|uniref:TUG ubiquitin-like domain-containing protein n=1 Tax=Coemansia aciculifera TaxID=417176 RepID=A0A9W8M908_9FUNG|nr:hypothetical protein GGH94_000528 [Coemansia aciculifera]KAJ2876841.1 hypothetical protein GGH93_000434 [Coemansia aciculifera]